MQRCNFQIHANLPVSVPAPTSDRVCPPLARSALRVVAYFPGKDRYSFPLWLFSCRRGSPYETGRRPGVSVFLAAARSAVPICRPGHQYRGQNKSRFRLEAAHLVQKTKCADLNMKSAAVGRFFAHCNRKSLAAANTRSRFSASNTVLLTCVIGNPPCAHVLPSHRSSLQWRTFVPAVKTASAWPHAHSTVSCRPCGLLLFAYPARGCTESACITVSTI